MNSDPSSSKRSRLVYNNQHQQHVLQQREQRRQQEIQQQRHQQQETLRNQEMAVVLAHQQQREHFLHNMRARQHQERQAALTTLAAANLVVYRNQPDHRQLTRYTGGDGRSSCGWPTYEVAGGQTQATKLSNNTRHQLHQMSSFQQITPPGSMPFCWAPGPAPPTSHHSTACHPTCCPAIVGTVGGSRSTGCSSIFPVGSQSSHGNYKQEQENLARSKQAATMAAMASCYGGSNPSSTLVPQPIPCVATPALTGGNPSTMATAAAAAAAMAGAAYCLGCVQGKCQVTWNKENAVNNGIMRSL